MRGFPTCANLTPPGRGGNMESRYKVDESDIRGLQSWVMKTIEAHFVTLTMVSDSRSLLSPP